MLETLTKLKEAVQRGLLGALSKTLDIEQVEKNKRTLAPFLKVADSARNRMKKIGALKKVPFDIKQKYVKDPSRSYVSISSASTSAFEGTSVWVYADGTVAHQGDTFGFGDALGMARGKDSKKVHIVKFKSAIKAFVDSWKDFNADESIDELTVKDLKKEIGGKTAPHKGTMARGKRLASNYVKANKDGELFFKTTSETTPGVDFWEQKVKLVDWDVAMSIPDPDMKHKERVNLAMAGDVQVHCECPAYKYWGYHYINSELDAEADKPERRFPGVRNPNLEGIGCKHIAQVLMVLPLNLSSVIKDAKKLVKL